MNLQCTTTVRREKIFVSNQEPKVTCIVQFVFAQLARCECPFVTLFAFEPLDAQPM